MAIILVVEDDTDTRQALGEYLTALFPDARVLMTESGENGLELAVRTRPTVVLLDLRLRGIHGFEFATRLRQYPVAAGVPIVALTGDMSPATLLKAEEADSPPSSVSPPTWTVWRRCCGRCSRAEPRRNPSSTRRRLSNR